jgi:hypothetical protein
MANFGNHHAFSKAKIFENIRYWADPIVASKSQFRDNTIIEGELAINTQVGATIS